MACRLVALDKEPGTRHVGIGEIYLRLSTKCAVEVCCAVHAVMAVVAAAGADEENSELLTQAEPQTEEPPPPTTHDFMTAEEVPAIEKADTTPVTLLVNARSGFNKLGCKTMLWTVCVQLLSPLGAANHATSRRLVLRHHLGGRRDPRGPAIHDLVWPCSAPPREGDSRSRSRRHASMGYADDYAVSGKTGPVAEGMILLEQLGPARRYFPEPAKSILICSPADMAAAKAALSRFDFRYQEGARYVDSFIGTEAAKKAWLEPQIEQWVEGIHALARIALHYPQTMYAGPSHSKRSGSTCTRSSKTLGTTLRPSRRRWRMCSYWRSLEGRRASNYGNCSRYRFDKPA